MNEAIFKAYDIRGRYPEELDKEAAQAIARAFAVFISRALKTKKPKIVVSRDARLSSPELEQAVIQGLQESGALVIRTGLASTPLFYLRITIKQLLRYIVVVEFGKRFKCRLTIDTPGVSIR